MPAKRSGQIEVYNMRESSMEQEELAASIKKADQYDIKHTDTCLTWRSPVGYEKVEEPFMLADGAGNFNAGSNGKENASLNSSCSVGQEELLASK